MRIRGNTYLEIVEPVDCERLATAFARLRWYCGYSCGHTAETVSRSIERLRAVAAGKFCQSGGIRLENGRLFVHHTLFTFYVLPPQLAAAPARAEEGDWLARFDP